MIGLTCAVLDTETTGFSPRRGDRLVEIAAVKIRNAQVMPEESFSTFINPERKIPPAATRVHKIVDDMVISAPLFHEVADGLLEFLGDVDYLFIHNAKFDLEFLEYEMKHCEKCLKLPKIICSVNLSRYLYPESQYHNLDAIAKRFGLKMQDGELRHRALGDVLMTAEALIKFYEDNPLTFFGTLENLADKQYFA